MDYKISYRDILNFLEKEKYNYFFVGNKEGYIVDFSVVKTSKPYSVTWIKNKASYNIKDISVKNQMLIVMNQSDKEDLPDYNIIWCNNPKEIFFSILQEFFRKETEPFINKKSEILSNKIGKNVSIGSGCFIDTDVTIEEDVVIKHNVIIEGRVEIGRGSIISSGVVIGTDGYGYYKNKNGENCKVPHFGGVKIGEKVEVGANTCIDRGTIEDTIIEDNVKIDNLCHIAHNVRIGKNSLVVAMAMLGGSSHLDEGSYVAPGVLIKNQISVAKNSLLGMGCVVVKDIEENKVVAGVPARVIRDNFEE